MRIICLEYSKSNEAATKMFWRTMVQNATILLLNGTQQIILHLLSDNCLIVYLTSSLLQNITGLKDSWTQNFDKIL